MMSIKLARNNINRIIFISFLFFYCLFSCGTQKQNIDAEIKKVKGTVVSADHYDVLPFVQIAVIGDKKNNKARKASTDFDGNFEIEAKKGEILEASYPGFYPERVIVSDSNDYKIKLTWNDGSRNKKSRREVKKLVRKNGWYTLPD
jgi:hypothetical protein